MDKFFSLWSLTLLYKNENEKRIPFDLFPSRFPFLSRAVGSYSNSGVRLWLYSTWGHLDSSTLHQNTTKQCFFICDLWPLSWFFTLSFTLGKGAHCVPSKQEVLGEVINSIEVEAIPSLCLPSAPAAVFTCVLLGTSWLHTCRRHRRCWPCVERTDRVNCADPFLSA